MKLNIKTILTVAMITALLFTVVVPIKGSTLKENEIDFKNVLRLHIIANSDCEEDQRIKLLVRDAILKYEYERKSAVNEEEAEKLIKENGDELLRVVRNVLYENNAEYDAQLILGDFDFPDRTYDNVLYPAGEYHALRLLLGDACGKNWWCVIFPPLCIIDAKDAKIENDEPVEFVSLFIKAINFIKENIFGLQEK